MATVLDKFPFRLSHDALLARLHLAPGSPEAGELRALLDKAVAVARPKAVYRECFIDGRGPDTVSIEGITFTSRVLRANLDQPERVFAYVATCGTEVSDLVPPDADLIEKYWLDAIKGEMLGAALKYLGEHLVRRHALGRTADMHPGSGDVTVWPIEQQRPLFELLGEVKGLIGVELTPSLLMLPNKSVSGFRYTTQADFRTCQLCHRPVCPSRQAAFDEQLWNAIGPGAPPQ